MTEYNITALRSSDPPVEPWGFIATIDGVEVFVPYQGGDGSELEAYITAKIETGELVCEPASNEAAP
jgi:hypothetical protein